MTSQFAVDPISYSSLYNTPIAARRTGPLFSAFPYPTKIDPEAVALYIAAHTRPGDTVLDCFAGSGTTGVAALLCERPTLEMLAAAQRHGIEAKWGPRNAILYEVGALGSFVARTLTSPPDPKRFKAAASALLKEIEAELAWMYEAEGPDGSMGHVRHTVWADEVRCPGCLKEVTMWDAAVTLGPARIASTFTCPRCRHEAQLAEVERVLRSVPDDLLGVEQVTRGRRPAQIYGRSGSKTWSRPPSHPDFERLARIDATPIPAAIPVCPIPWGDLYRSGYHRGISHLHHFYTRRNLIVFGRLWEAASAAPSDLIDSLRFWLLSYNASHATLMTRVVAKQNMPDLVVTSAQPGVLYVSGLPVEKNLFEGLRRKIKVLQEAFQITFACTGSVRVVNESSRGIGLPDDSIDYIFTDPPFGGNIPYAEVNFINEAWLDSLTDKTEEVIISPSQGKGLADYQTLLTDVFGQCRRVLKDSGRATVIFHSASAAVWNALRTSYRGAGFAVERASVLDKVQGSFKQVTTAGAVKGDPALLLRKDAVFAAETPIRDWRQISRNWLAGCEDKAGATPQHLYSRLVGHYLAAHQEVPVSADAFYRWIREQVETDGISIPAE